MRQNGNLEKFHGGPIGTGRVLSEREAEHLHVLAQTILYPCHNLTPS